MPASNQIIETRARRSSLAKLSILFLLSGAAALVVETTWLRWFRLLFGATAAATTATLIAFFAGNALGAALGARGIRRIRNPLRAYGLLEWGAAGWALAMPLLLAAGQAAVSGSYDALRETPTLLLLFRLTLALVVSLPASLCFGATLPAIGAAAMGDHRALGTTGTLLYAMNTLGAALGTALACFWLPEWLGVNATYALGVGLSLLAGGGALWLVRGGATPPACEREDRRPSRPRSGSRGPEISALSAEPVAPHLLGLAALSGFGAFAAQVLFVQAYAQVLNQSVTAFGAVLVCVLLTLALGAFAISRLERRRAPRDRTLLGLALGTTALGLAAFPALLNRATDGLRYLGSGDPWPGYLVETVLSVMASAGPALLAAATVFPLVLVLAGRSGGTAPLASAEAGARLGRLAAANTLGAIAGALAAPYLLLPALGLWGSFLALALVYALPALFTGDAGVRSRWLRDLALALGWVVILCLANPLAYPLTRLEPGEKLLHQESRAAGVVSVVEREGERLIRTDNHYVMGGTADSLHQRRQGHLPLLLHAAPRRVAFVGSATGISAGAALAHPVESIQLVEIVPGVAEAARRFFGQANGGVYRDPRTRVVLDDARNFLRATGDRFDVVVADLFVPWRSGTGSLYTREHFAAVREHLAVDGLFCQWLPLYQLGAEEFRIIAATFADVFPDAALFRGDFYGRFPIVALVGWRGRPAAPKRVAAAAERLARTGEGDRWVVDPVGIWSLYAGPLPRFGADAIPRNSDDQPRIEFLAARAHVGGDRGKIEPLVGLAWIGLQADLRGGAGETGDPVYPTLSAEGRRASRGGAALQLAGSLYAAGRIAESSRALALAGERIPSHLLAEAEADSTASEVWYPE